MSGFQPYPLTFEPVLKDYIWGGRNLAHLFGRNLPPGVIAESWEIAAHRDGVTPVDNGPLAGELLTELCDRFGEDLVGQRAGWVKGRGQFPLLIKLLDANRRLSVQVHPDDEFARLHEGNELGKTEMWVVLHAQPDAAIVLGVKQGMTAEVFQEALEDGNLESCLHIVPVSSGDAVCVPSGTLHAILGGAVIAEIQQNSNTTYRVFDWNRLENGEPRPLHIDKALQVIDFELSEQGAVRPRLIEDSRGIKRFMLCSNRYFVCERVEMESSASFEGHCDGGSMEIWGVIKGVASVNNVTLSAIQFTLLPATYGPFMFTSATQSTLLRVTLG